MQDTLFDEPQVQEKQKKQEVIPPNPRVRGGYFVVGDTPADELFITEEFNEDAQMIGEMVVDFCKQEIQDPFFQTGKELVVTNLEDRNKVVQLLKKAGELGLASVTVPEEYGGMGLDTKTNTLISFLMSNGFSFATTLGAQTSIGVLPIVYYGNEAQKQKYLPKIASAEYIAAYALTEPQAGSDANSGRTKATLSEDEQHYVLNGQKIWITNGGIADVYIVFAKIDDDKNLSAFIVERDFEGFSVGAEEKKLGIKGSSTVQIYFDNCKVPVENLLGSRQGGFKMALNILNGGRLKAGSGGVGGSINALDKAIEYANERKQFGKPIAQFGAIQYKIGDIAMQAFANEAAAFRVADLIDRKEAELKSIGLAENKAKIQATAEFAIEASIIKVKGSELSCYAIDEALQVYGGMGYSEETGLAMGWRDARILKIYEGTNEINSLLIVGELFKRSLGKKKTIDLKAAGKGVTNFLLSQLNPFRSKSGYAEPERIIKGLKNTFLFISGMAGRKFKKELINEQEIILNLSTLLQEAFVCESALLKIKKLEKTNNNKEKLTIQRQMMELYLYEALEKSRKAALEAVASFATGSEKRNYTRAVKIMLKPYDINPKALRRNIAQAVINKGKYNL